MKPIGFGRARDRRRQLPVLPSRRRASDGGDFLRLFQT